MRKIACIFILVLISGLGCGSGSPYKYVKVKGKVTYDDGTVIPPKGLRLRFVPLDAPIVENATPRAAFALFDDQGNFDSVTSYKYGDGLIRGKHKVAIEAADGPPKQLVVPKEYQSTSTTPLMVDTAEVPFEVKVPKPKGNR
jgi:hypothetical protein